MADDDAIAGLIVDLAELRREVDELRGLRDQLADVAATVATVREQLERLASDADVVHPRVVWWPDLDEGKRDELTAALNVWVAEVLLTRYPLAQQTLYPCWDRHSEVVDALTALYATWRAAYQNPSAPPVDAATWLDRWLPSLLGHMRTGLRSCERSAHVDRKHPEVPLPMSDSSIERGAGLFAVARANGETLITNVRKLAGTERAPGSALIAWAAWLLAALGAGLFVVSFAAQYTYILAAKHQSVPSIIEALMLDVLLIVFSLLALGLSRAGKSSRTERVLIMACAAASAYMNVSAADVSSPRSVVAFAAPPVCLAIVVDRVVAVVRRHVLADDEASAWTALGRAVLTAARLAGTIALYSLRLILAPPSTASGLRRWVLVLAPLPAVERSAVPAAEVPAIERSPGPEPPELEGMTKKAKLTYWYARDPAYGDRGQASKAARRIAPRIGLSEGTARAYVAEILRTLPAARSTSPRG